MDKEEGAYPMRINKYLALKQISTRRGADELIASKKVFINGKLAVLGSKVEDKDEVEVRGHKPKAYVYYAYNKPVGVETSSPKEGLFPIGRLDKASHGLLIVTNDGRITEALLSPLYDHEKEYIVHTKEKLRSNFKQKMEKGVDIEGYKTKKCKVDIIGTNKFKIILT
ncbi:23S rRNA pseudouridine synthase F, partial [Patescibacteria group bacterium]|nr:23S rRNA pseudouridine synthase F [Patescibacteria group bacterium]